MRGREKLGKGTHRKMRAKRPKVAARIFLCVPFPSFSLPRIGSALLGVSWVPQGTPAQCVEMNLRWQFCVHTSRCALESTSNQSFE